MKRNSNALREQSLKLAQFVELDGEEMKYAINEMVEKAKLPEDHAKAVALAIREQQLPDILKEIGLGDDVVHEFVGKGIDDEDFGDDEFENDEFENDEECGTCHLEDDEVDDNIATIHISIPESKVALVEEAISKILEDGIDGESNENELDEESNDDLGEESNNESEEEEDIKVTSMNKDELLKRQANRKMILAELNDDEPSITGTKPVYGDEGQPKGEIALDKWNFDGSNPLESQNPTYAEQKIPTLVDNMQRHMDIKGTHFDNSPEDPDFYKIEFDPMKIPYQGVADLESPKIPTQTEVGRRLQTTASVTEEEEEALAGLLVEAGVDPSDIQQLTYSDGLKLYNKIVESKKSKEDKKEAADIDVITDGATIEVKSENTTSNDVSAEEKMDMQKAAELFRARIRTAYKVANQLVQESLIEFGDVEPYVDQMLNDGTTVTAMIRQAEMLIKTSRANNSRTKTASNKNVVNTPGVQFRSKEEFYPGVIDIQEALKGQFTGSKYQRDKEDN